MTDQAAVVRAVAVKRLTDQAILVEVARRDKATVVRFAAVRRLTDQRVLTQIVMTDEDWRIRKAAFAKVTDKAALTALGRESTDPAIRMAVQIRLGKRTWSNVFSGTGQSRHETETVIGAMALSRRDPAIARNVEGICHGYIRAGDIARIPELIELLNLYGTKTLAEDYLNCGQRDVARAGSEWAKERGYNTITVPGSPRIRWGEGR